MLAALTCILSVLYGDSLPVRSYFARDLVKDGHGLTRSTQIGQILSLSGNGPSDAQRRLLISKLQNGLGLYPGIWVKISFFFFAIVL